MAARIAQGRATRGRWSTVKGVGDCGPPAWPPGTPRDTPGHLIDREAPQRLQAIGMAARIAKGRPRRAAGMRRVIEV